MEAEQIEKYIQQATDGLMYYLPKAALAIILLLIGMRVINKLVRLLMKAMKRAGMAENILPFLSSIVNIGLKLALFFVVAGTLGFDTAGLVTVIAAAGFAVGLALQGSLSNFAAGILILIFRPYKIGDWIQIDDFFGKVAEIQIFNTLLTTPGRKTLIIPNGQVVENVVTNFSELGQVRLELRVLMAYEENFPRIKQIITDAMQDCDLVLSDPLPSIGIESFDTHNIVVAVRPYVHPETYWEATFQVNEHIKAALSQAGIRMAYSEGVELGPIGG